MKIMHENFVGTYDGFFSDSFCDNLVDYFEWCQKNNKTHGRSESEKIKNDEAINLTPFSTTEINFVFPQITGFISEFNDKFWNECYADYSKKYSVLKDYSEHTIFSYKIQKTIPTGGYHIWHSENGSVEYSRRIGVYILFLNDVEEGGETEFLYFSKRINAKKGRLIIFPPNFPWAHRGNPPLSNTKYIMTGWIELK